MHKLLGSSVNPEQLALTVKGILTAIAPVVFLIARAKGLSLGDEQWSAIINVILDLIAQLGALAGTLMTIYGAGRKVWMWWKARNQNQ